MTAWFSLSSLWIVARSPHCCRIGDRQLPVVQLYRDIPIAREGRIVVNADGVNRSACLIPYSHTRRARMPEARGGVFGILWPERGRVFSATIWVKATAVRPLSGSTPVFMARFSPSARVATEATREILPFWRVQKSQTQRDGVASPGVHRGVVFDLGGPLMLLQCYAPHQHRQTRAFCDRDHLASAMHR